MTSDLEGQAVKLTKVDGAVLEAAYPDEDCGCPVEEWVCCGVSMILHHEPDGSMEVFADTGDWDHSFALTATTMEGARAEAFSWARNLPAEDEIPAGRHALENQ